MTRADGQELSGQSTLPASAQKKMQKSIKQERMTAQKTFVFNYLKSVKTHPTAEIVYKEVKKKLPNISQSTVYRVLNDFKGKGEVQTIDTRGNIHFDADISDHAHFICEACGKVYDVYDECAHCGILKKRKTKVGKINKYQIKFYGICTRCPPAGRAGK